MYSHVISMFGCLQMYCYALLIVAVLEVITDQCSAFDLFIKIEVLAVIIVAQLYLISSIPLNDTSEYIGLVSQLHTVCTQREVESAVESTCG